MIALKLYLLYSILYLEMIKNITFEPLLHFILLGAVLYLYFSYIDTEEVDTKTAISVSSEELDIIKSEYYKNFSKEMHQEQLDAFKIQKIYEKILLNEAYALGLHKQDKEIELKLLKQMEHILSNQSLSTEPTEKELYEYYTKNIVQYSKVMDITFSHIYFPRELNDKAMKTLTLLKIANVLPNKASYYGEEFQHGNTFEAISLGEIRDKFGKYFTSKVLDLRIGIWSKPIYSKYGIHIVYLEKKNAIQPLVFDDVQERVYLDYLEEKRESVKSEAYKELSSQYIIEVK